MVKPIDSVTVLSSLGVDGAFQREAHPNRKGTVAMTAQTKTTATRKPATAAKTAGRKPAQAVVTPPPVPAGVGRNGRAMGPKYTECTLNPLEGWGGCGWQFTSAQSRPNCRVQHACGRRKEEGYLGSERYVAVVTAYGRKPSEAALKIINPPARKPRKAATAKPAATGATPAAKAAPKPAAKPGTPKPAAPSATPASVAPSVAPKPATAPAPKPSAPAPAPAPAPATAPATPSVLGGLTR